MSLCDSCSPKRWCSVDKNRTECRFYQPITNEEWLRTLPADEQVKEVLSRGFMTEERTAEEFVNWLKEIHHAN